MVIQTSAFLLRYQFASTLNCSSALQNVIEKQRLVYLGSMPLLSLENYIHQLKQLTVDKNEALKSMYNAQKYENECEILKEELEKQLGSDKDKLATEKCGDQKDSRSLQLQVSLF